MKFVIALLFALSVPCWASNQVIFGSQAGQAVPTTGQSWIGLAPRNDVNVWASTPATGNSYALMPTTGTFNSFCVNLTKAPGAGASWTWTLYKNGADQAVAVTISGTQTQVCDLVDTSGFVPGDLVALHVTPSVSPAPAATFSSWYIAQTPQVAGETILFGSQQVSSGQYLSLGGNSSSLSTEAAMATIIPAAGTVTKFVAEYVGTGTSVNAALDQNQSATTLSASLTTSGVYAALAGNLSVAAGDVFDVNETGITATSAMYASMVFVPSVTGEFVIPTWRNALSNAHPLFYLPVTGRSNDNLQTTEAGAQQIGDNVEIQGIFVQATAAPGSGTQYGFTLRDNGANTTLSATLSGTSLKACMTSATVAGCSSGPAVAVNNFDLLDTSVAVTGSPAASVASVSYLAYVPQLVFTTEPPATGTPGTALSAVVVQVQDASGNPIAGSTAQVTISSSPAGVGGTLTANAVNGVATFSNLVFGSAGTYTLTASASGLAAVVSSTISVAVGPASKLGFTSQPSAGGAGAALTPVVVHVEDANGNLVVASSAAVTISSSPAGVMGTLTVNAVNGVATFSNLVFNTLGSYTLSAVSSGLTGATSGAIAIGAGPVSKLVFTTQPPASATAGATLSGVAVQLEDAFGNFVSGSSAAVTLSSTPAGVAGTLTVNAVNGVATFSNLMFPMVGSYTLTAATSGATGTPSSSIAIAAGPASKLGFTTQPPATGTAGTALSAVVVQVEDANGNPVTGSTAQVTISSTPAGVSGTLTATAVNGAAKFSTLDFNALGIYTLTAASSGLTAASSSSFVIQANRPTSQFLFGSQADVAVPNSSASYIGLVPRDDASAWVNNPNTGTTYAVMPTTGTLGSFCVNLTVAPGTGASWIWTLFKDGLDQPVSVTISGTQTQACDLVDTTGFVPGDLVALHVTPSAGPAPAVTEASWYIVQTPQIPGETILFGSQQVAGAQWLSLAGNSNSTGTDEAAMATIIPAAGTITKFVAAYIGSGSGVTAVLDQNEAASALSSSLIASGSLFQAPGNLSVAAGDVFDVSETGITGTSAFYASFVFLPSVGGEFAIPASRNAVSGADAVFYLPVTGKSNGSLEATEAQARQIAANLQIQGMYVRGSVAPGGTAQYAFTLRDNGANSSLNTTLSGTNTTACTTSATVTGCATQSAIAVNNLDLLDTAVVPTGTPASLGGDGAAVSYLAYVPQLVLSTPPPATVTAGTALSAVVVQLQDQNGNAVTGSTAQVTISSNPAGVSGTLTANAVNGVATFSNLVLNTAGSYTLTATVSGLGAVTSSAISVAVGPASKLAFTTQPPAAGTAGTGLPAVVVQVQDASGNLVTGSSAAVTISSTPAGVGGTLTVNAVNGVATFSTLILNTAGAYTLTAASTGLTSATSNSITVAGPAAKLVFTTQPPANGAAGTAFGAVVQIQDASGFLVATSTASVTITSTSAGVTGTLTVAAVGGVANFSNLTFNTPGVYTLSAASAGLTGATSSSITVAGPASKLIFTTQPPATGTAATAFGAVVQVQDANGYLVTTSTASVTITSTAAGVSGTTTVPAVGGVATFSSLQFKASGTYTLSAAANGLTAATSSSIVIAAGPAAKLAFTTQPPASGTTGTLLGTVVAQVEDANGNLVTGSAASISIVSSPTGLSGTVTVSAVNGVATFSNLVFPTAGTYSVAVGSTGLTTAISSTSVTIVLGPSFTIAGTAVKVLPGATTANTSTITITPVDGFTGSVTLAAALAGSANDPPTLSFGSTSPVTISGTTAGTATLTVLTTAPTVAALAYPQGQKTPWYVPGGATLAVLLLFGVPKRRRGWRTMLGMLLFLVVLMGGAVGCFGGGSSSTGTSNPGTTAGIYTIIVTGTSGTNIATTSVTLTVQ